MNDLIEYLVKKNPGAYRVEKGGEELIFRCPKCGRDKFYVNLKKAAAHCFRCSWSKRAPRLWKKAVNFVMPKARAEEVEEKVYIPETYPCLFPEAIKFLKTKGIACEEANDKRWGMTDDPRLIGRLVIPIMENREIKTYVARAVNGETPKEISGTNRSNYLYGYDNIRGRCQLVLVEGIFDAEALLRKGYWALALMGSYLSDVQLGKLAALRPLAVTIMMDGDEAGWRATLKIKHKLAKRFDPFKIKVAIVPDGKDPDELSTQEVDDILREAN